MWRKLKLNKAHFRIKKLTQQIDLPRNLQCLKTQNTVTGS